MWSGTAAACRQGMDGVKTWQPQTTRLAEGELRSANQPTSPPLLNAWLQSNSWPESGGWHFEHGDRDRCMWLTVASPTDATIKWSPFSLLLQKDDPKLKCLNNGGIADPVFWDNHGNKNLGPRRYRRYGYSTCSVRVLSRHKQRETKFLTRPIPGLAHGGL